MTGVPWELSRASPQFPAVGRVSPNTEVQDSGAEVRPGEEEASEQEVVCHPEKARLSSEQFEASICHAEASPRIPEEPLIIPETSRQQDKQSATSKYQTQPRTDRAAPEIQGIEKQLWEKERRLQIREAEVRKMTQAVIERREVMDLQEDNLRQRSAAIKEWEDDLRLREAAMTQQMVIVGQPNGAAQESDLLSLSSISTIRNRFRVRGNVDLPPKSSAGLKRDSWDHGDELASLASTTRGSPSKHTNKGFSSSKSHAGLKEDSEY